ncbi:DUF1573 domain-containing protein [Bacteroidota bacterium]
MKRLYFIITLLGALNIINTISAQSVKGPIASFEETSHDFGDLIQGDKVNYTFEFTNTGKQPLLISNVLTTCGCTATKWTKKPVEPGKTGQVKITFDSTGKMGKQNKIITVVSNAELQHSRLSITASVLPKKGSY